LLGLLAGAVGTGGALLAVHLTGAGGGIGGGRALATFGICVTLAAVGALAARVGASLSVFRGSVSEARQSVHREGKPLWQRLYRYVQPAGTCRRTADTRSGCRGERAARHGRQA